jgi:hypothetical protein
LANLIVAIISVAIVIAAISAFGESTVGPAAQLSGSFKAAEWRAGEAARTSMTSVSVTVSGGGSQVDWRARNSGQAPVRDFPNWDLIVRYHGPTSGALKVQRLTYTTTNPPPAGQWTVSTIYAGSGGTGEVFQPGIADPGEEFNLRATLSPVIAASTSNSLTVAAPNGVSLKSAFTN